MTPTPVVVHWPYVRRHLELSRMRPAAQVLDLLAELQHDAGGEGVRLPRSRLTGHELPTGRKTSPGDAGAMYNALVALERRRVVNRARGSGRRADAWSIVGDLRHWQAMPWTLAARDVERAARACICVTFRPVAARIPGHSVGVDRQFWLSADDHLQRPGLFPVDMWHNGAKSDTTGRRPGPKPVDSRDYDGAGAPPYLSTGRTYVLPLPPEERERVAALVGAITENTGQPVFGAPLRKLEELARRLDDEQVRLVVFELGREPPSYAVRMVDVACDIATGRLVKGTARGAPIEDPLGLGEALAATRWAEEA